MKCVSVVGIGPGNELYLSIAAKETLEDSDLIVGSICLKKSICTLV